MKNEYVTDKGKGVGVGRIFLVKGNGPDKSHWKSYQDRIFTLSSYSFHLSVHFMLVFLLYKEIKVIFRHSSVFKVLFYHLWNNLNSLAQNLVFYTLPACFSFIWFFFWNIYFDRLRTFCSWMNHTHCYSKFLGHWCKILNSVVVSLQYLVTSFCASMPSWYLSMPNLKGFMSFTVVSRSIYV